MEMRRWLVLAALATPLAAVQAAGRIEINQASVVAAGGFPFVIDASGNYVLTSDLLVTEDEINAITISALGGTITIDLNGFRIEGPFLNCTPGNCPQGSASGIGMEGFASASVIVSGGAVTNFSGDCILVGRDSRVVDIRVSTCGRSGIVANIGSVVRGNTVSWTGEYGIRLSDDDGGAYAHNAVRSAGAAGGDHTAVTGGSATVGNVCDDGSCAATPTRRYYITQHQVDGDEVLQACDAGFHAASMWEILDTSNLYYDTTRGGTFGVPDQGNGPPAEIWGWVRTGYLGFATGQPAGRTSCNAWTSDSESDRGTIVQLKTRWGESDLTFVSPWIPNVAFCDGTAAVWCIAD